MINLSLHELRLTAHIRNISDYQNNPEEDLIKALSESKPNQSQTGNIRTLFKFDSDYYKPIRTDDGFAGRRNNYIEYKSKGDRYENLSPKEYLNMIRPYLRDLINEHKPIDESNDDDDDDDDDDTDRAEWKIQLTM